MHPDLTIKHRGLSKDATEATKACGDGSASTVVTETLFSPSADDVRPYDEL